MEQDELRAAFNYQYIFTDVIRSTENSCERSFGKFSDIILKVNPYHRDYENGAYLGDTVIHLMQVKDITDEDAVELGRMHGHEDEENLWTDEYLLYVGKRVSGYFPNYTTPVPVIDLIRITDYLRSKGYALPFRGISVERQVELGWIRLIPSSK